MTVEKKAKRRAILIFMLNRSGVLNKISMLIRRKMYNVETITACTTSRPGISRMTLTLREDSDQDIDRSFWREVAIVKFEVEDADLAHLQTVHKIDILDHHDGGECVVQIAGTSQMIDDFLQAVGDEKIIEVARSGFTALEK